MTLRKLHFKKLLFTVVLFVMLFVFCWSAASGVLTKLTAWQINSVSNLPVALLAYDHEVNASSYTVLPMFGGTAYTRGTGDEVLEFHVSPWPDLSDKDMRVTYIFCTDQEYSVFGFSPGDNAIKGMLILTALRFIPTEMDSGEARFEKWGITVTLDWNPDTYRIYGIRIHACAANENGILF